MSLDSIDMSTTVPGYGFAPDPDLLAGNFIDPAAFQAPGLQENFFNVDFAADQNVGAENQFNQLDAGGFPATIDANMWSQLGSRPDEASGTFDFSDLIVFP